jgi:hypothetical protein
VWAWERGLRELVFFSFSVMSHMMLVLFLNNIIKIKFYVFFFFFFFFSCLSHSLLFKISDPFVVISHIIIFMGSLVMSNYSAYL